jgi:23S rRNA (uracil1939-C5)-methyltransferase
MTSKPKFNQKISLTIQRLGIHGEGIGYWHGYTVFVDGPLPGEIVQAIMTETKKNYGRARLLTIDNPAPTRVKPPCPLFGRCGGCQIMHMSYEAQLDMKRQRIVDAFERIGKFENPPVEKCTPSPDPLGYRNKIQIPIGVGTNGEIRMGFYARSSHDLVDVEHCYIHCPLGEEVYKNLQQLIKTSDLIPFDWNTHQGELRNVIIKSAVNTEEVLVVFITNKCSSTKLEKIANALMLACPTVKGVVQNINSVAENVIFGKEFKLIAGVSQITEILSGLKFKISASSFFQVNPAQAEQLFNKAIEFCGLTGKEKVLDAYCGVGTLALISSRKAKEVIGIECVAEAIEDAKENARINQIENVQFVCDTAESRIEQINDIDVVILNPPRKGCEPSLLHSLSKKKPQTIVYISCDPATLARDVAILRENHYVVEAIQPFDMFPQTAHVETLVKLRLNQN